MVSRAGRCRLAAAAGLAPGVKFSSQFDFDSCRIRQLILGTIQAENRRQGQNIPQPLTLMLEPTNEHPAA